MQYLRGKNIILSSGADAHSQLRGPNDVIAMGKNLQLNSENAIKAVTANPAKVIQRAALRRLRFINAAVLSHGAFEERHPELAVLMRENRENWRDALDASVSSRMMTVRALAGAGSVGNALEESSGSESDADADDADEGDIDKEDNEIDNSELEAMSGDDEAEDNQENGNNMGDSDQNRNEVVERNGEEDSVSGSDDDMMAFGTDATDNDKQTNSVDDKEVKVGKERESGSSSGEDDDMLEFSAKVDDGNESEESVDSTGFLTFGTSAPDLAIDTGNNKRKFNSDNSQQPTKRPAVNSTSNNGNNTKKSNNSDKNYNKLSIGGKGNTNNTNVTKNKITSTGNTKAPVAGSLLGLAAKMSPNGSGSTGNRLLGMMKGNKR